MHYNDRNQAIYRCRNRGSGCHQSGRAANGLHRATVLGMRVLTSDLCLQRAIRHQLTAHQRAAPPKGPSLTTVIASLKKKERKLLDLYYGEQIDPHTFAAERRDIITKMKTLQKESDDLEREQKVRNEVAELLSKMDFEQMWGAATLAERRTLVEDMVHSVYIYPDRLAVQVAGAPPFIVALDEVALTQGCKPVVSKAV